MGEDAKTTDGPFVIEGDLLLVQGWEYGPLFEIDGKDFSDVVREHFGLKWEYVRKRVEECVLVGKVRITIERL